MPSFWWWFLQIHGGPAVGDGNILLWGMFEHSYHFKSQIDLDLDRSIRCIFFWVGASGKTGYIYIYIATKHVERAREKRLENGAIPEVQATMRSIRIS